MEKTMKNALVFGATGLVGKELIRQLVKASTYNQIFFLARKLDSELSGLVKNYPQKLIPILLNDLGQWKGVLEDSYGEIDIFCALGTTIKTAGSREAFKKIDFELVINLFKKAKNLNIHSVALVSSMGADPKSKIFYSQIKGEVEQALIAMDFPYLLIVRPSLLLGNREEFRLGEKIMRDLSPFLNVFLLGPLSEYRPVHCSLVSATMIKELQSDHANKLKILTNKDIHQYNL